MFRDTHAHLDTFLADGDLEAVARRAMQAGVEGILAVGGSVDMNRAALEAARRFPEQIRAALGMDCRQAGPPAGCGEELKRALKEPAACLRESLSCGHGVCALGEIGLDFHYTPETADAQAVLFRAQLDLARELRLPVIVHSREAEEATLAELTRHARAWPGEGRLPGVLHCFTGSMGFAEQLLALGLHISFSGIVTFRNAAPLREVAAMVPDDRLLIETDAPYLAPEPHRGQTNEPAFVVRVAETLAAVRGCTLESIARITSTNAQELFGLGRG
jgi:TatD DNase family protein